MTKLLCVSAVLCFNLTGSVGLADQAVNCKVTNQSGTQDTSFCTGEERIRCYADVEQDGQEFRVYGSSCWETYQDCFWSGAGAFDPCP
jgi:hypothetical protein